MKKTVTLSQPIKGQRGPIKSITLNEPKYSDFIDLGMPSVWVALAEGGFSQESPQLLGQWIERLADCDPNFISQLSLKDTLALRGAVLNFFIEAALPDQELASSPSLPSEPSSPSSSTPTFGPSTI